MTRPHPGAALTEPVSRLYEPDNARHPVQRERMQRLEAAGACLFCPDRLRCEPALLRLGSWTVIANRFPYDGARVHLLAVPERHVEDMADLDRVEVDVLPGVVRWARDRFGLAGYAILARSGDPQMSGASIRHWHLHLIGGGPITARVKAPT